MATDDHPSAVDRLRIACVAATDSPEAAMAGERVAQSAVASSASMAESGEVGTVPSPRALGALADAVGELSLQTGARLRDVARIAMAAAAAAGRISNLDEAEAHAYLRSLYATELPPFTVE